jgi:guanosine-3',5'-bis(diphosphate) 3'-pyrophosphohydrolase
MPCSFVGSLRSICVRRKRMGILREKSSMAEFDFWAAFSRAMLRRSSRRQSRFDLPYWKVTHSTNQLDAVFTAAHFAAEKHSNQRRKGKGGEPYINHLLEVAQLISHALPEPDTNMVVAALLHDVVEDAGVTNEELVERFGADVADLVAEVTDDKSLPKAERKRLQVEHAPHKSVRAQSIKLADKISNLRAILASPPIDWDFQRQKEYFEWAKRVVDGLTAPDPVLKAEFDRTWRRFDGADQRSVSD